MGESRNVYVELEDKVLLRTADVYQTAVGDDVESYSDTLLAVVANFRNAGRPEGFNAQSMAGKSKRGEIACRLFAVVDPDTGHHGLRERRVLDDGGPPAGGRAGHHRG